MRLIDPAPGEVIDRITILQLKIIRAQTDPKCGLRSTTTGSHWQEEVNALMLRLQGWSLRLEWFSSFLELAAVNGLLWQAMDRMDGYRASYTDQDIPDVAALGLQIYSLNTRRANIVSEINQWMGRLQDKPREKQ